MAAAPDAAEAIEEASNVAKVYGTKQKRMTTSLNFLDDAGTKPVQRQASSQDDFSESSEPPSPSMQPGAHAATEGAAADMMLPSAASAPAAAPEPKKFGTFMGVFVPCCQNILGVILFLRLGTIVGQAGVNVTLIVVGICCLTTFCTALSLSAIATNGAIKSGGPYYLISRALGPEFGGAVGLCFYMGTTVAGAMYILGAVETLKLTFPGLSIIEGETTCTNQGEADECCITTELMDYRVLGAIILVLCTSLVGGGVKYVSIVSPLFLIPVVLSIACILLGIATAEARQDYFTTLAEETCTGEGDDTCINVTAHWSGSNDGTAWTPRGTCADGVVTVRRPLQP